MDKAAKVLLGAGVATLAVIGIAKISQASGGGGGQLTYSGAQGSKYQSWTGSVWAAVRYSVNVQNGTLYPVAKTLTLWASSSIFPGPPIAVVANDQNGSPVTIPVNLDPGESRLVAVDTGPGSAVCLLSGPVDLWLQDAEGNKSPVAAVS